jgi:uncharacterized protein YbjQ (UPF0145 family)
MIISTMNDLPAIKSTRCAARFGLTVRSRNVGSQIGASVKSLVGGELKGMTKMLAERLEHPTVIAFRFDTSELGSTWTEICAYGTAVKATRAN